MKFVFVNYVRSPGFHRPEDWIRRLQGYTGILESLSNTQEVVSVEQIDYEGQLEQLGVQYRFVRFPKDRVHFPFRLHRYIKTLAPEVVFVHSLHFPLEVIQLRRMLGRNVRIFIQHHAEKPFSGVKKFAQRMADRCVDGYFFAAASMGQAWVRQRMIASSKKVFELMEASSVFAPIEPSVARERTGTTGTLNFLWVGRLDANKDPLLVVRNFLIFSKVNSGVRLFLIHTGDELLPALESTLSDSGDPVAIRLIAGLPHKEMSWWFSSADFIISSSHYEGSGVAVCEAMSCGCIPLLTDIDSFRAMTQQGYCGGLFPPGNDEAFLQMLGWSLTIDRSQYRERALTQFQKNLSFDAIARRLVQVVVSG